jgi:Spy/CpxP family protein refolding chaperone
MTQPLLNSKRKTIATLVGAAVLTLSMSATAMACGGPGKALRDLDLTSDQKDQVKELMTSKRDEKKAFKQKRKALKEKRSALADSYTEELALEVATEAGELEKESMLLRIQHQQSILAILNDEQKDQFKKKMEEKEHKGKDRHHKFD